MSIQVETVTLPESWASALVNGDTSGMNDQDIAALEAWQSANPEYEVVDVARDSEGNGDEGRFTWSYDLYGGTARGGTVLDYVAHVREPQSRPLHVIAREISADWKRPYFGAVPYLRAMHDLTYASSCYGQDSAQSIILYFLSNASSWRGETAKRVKAELKAMVGVK